MNIVLLVSSPNIPFRARKIAGKLLGSVGALLDSSSNHEIGKIRVTEILVRELGYHTIFTKKQDKKEYLGDRKNSSNLYALALQFDDEISRAKLTYVREYHTLRGMSRLRKAKPDLIVDISDESEIHQIVIESSRLGIMGMVRKKLDGEKEFYTTKLHSIDGTSEELITRHSEESENTLTTKRTVLLESIALLSSR